MGGERKDWDNFYPQEEDQQPVRWEDDGRCNYKLYNGWFYDGHETAWSKYPLVIHVNNEGRFVGKRIVDGKYETVSISLAFDKLFEQMDGLGNANSWWGEQDNAT